jgi:hypothetical protein
MRPATFEAEISGTIILSIQLDCLEIFDSF